MTDNIKRCIDDIHAGKPIIIVDSDDREAEGDLMIAAEKATPETLAFIAREARGIMCVPAPSFVWNRLQIPMSYSNNNDKFSTPFTVSFDARHNISTGVSVDDRMETLRLILDDTTLPEQLALPGHLFGLRSRNGLLNDRQGHTEISVWLCIEAKLKPIAVICEIMNDDGSMARLQPDLISYAKKHGLNVITIDEIIEYSNNTNWSPPYSLETGR